jgi:hypothetical protein
VTAPGDSDEILAVALAGGDEQKDAAAKAGVSESTVTRRLRDPAFRDRVANIRRTVTESALGALVKSLKDAAAALHLIATCSDDEKNQLAASKALLELGLKYTAQADLAERVRRLEEAASGRAAGAGGEAGAGGGGDGRDPPGPESVQG